ncbi:MAG TPA: DNA mismatch repair endonuclease MutL [Candidatus Polarisedimenticolia bacterium]|jgi:DNA mismatch repair protein MutL|nr:DNA mismatch repair endonuclease MutL [Candidatus Polarisedimenticolia bacterium]
MASIRVLPPEVANQIAAGEVIERPASVLKELLENALDAGASRVSVRLEGGGADLVEVADDGCGMTPEDAPRALLRHATSKVSSASDLQRVMTFGFRGEALPSIASVSRLTLTTSTGERDGVRVRVESGHSFPPEPAAHPRGTTVRVDALFHNAPARRKFLRAPGTEAGHALDHLGRIAAAHPAVAFRLAIHDRPAVDWPAAADLRARAVQILGREEGEALLPVEAAAGTHRLRGLVSAPGLERASSRYVWIYVHGRPIRDRRLLHAVSQAYASILPHGRFPIAILFLEMPTEEVDVNVHPAKSEVRFARPTAVHDLVRRAVRDALARARPFASLDGRTLVPDEAPPFGRGPDVAPSSPVTVSEPIAPGQRDDHGWSASLRREKEQEARTGSDLSPAGAGAPLAPPSLLRALAQFRDTYILAAAPDGLVIVDQHAAHERVLYERLLHDALLARVERQRLLFPLVLEVAPPQRAAFEAEREAFETLGFALEAFGPGSLRVEEVPGLLPAAGAERLVRALLDELLDEQRPRAPEEARHRIAALSACHAAVRANEPLPHAALERLMADLLLARAPMTCPHGRPTVLRLPIERLEREFGRR